MSSRILIVEDNKDLALGLRRSLESAGYQVDVTGDGAAALSSLGSRPPDLVVLDLMLPHMDGFDVLRQMRARGHETPVLILSAKGEEADKVRGFRSGADNYAVKPIGVLELLARVESMLRRSPRRAPEPAWTFGNVIVDAATRTVLRDGRAVDLSPKELDLLLHLLRARGAVVGRDDLLRDVWGYKRSVPTRTVDAHVALLRGKLEENPSRPRYLLTVRKSGYRLERDGR
jgi:DNA-binding response OmpR family regulator